MGVWGQSIQISAAAQPSAVCCQMPMGQRKLLKAAIRELVNQSPAARDNPEEGPPEMQPGEDLGEGTPPTVPPVTPAGLRRDPQLLEAGKTFDDLFNMPEIVKTLHKPDDHQQFDPRAILTIKAT